jgi:hypothetical protein
MKIINYNLAGPFLNYIKTLKENRKDKNSIRFLFLRTSGLALKHDRSQLISSRLIRLLFVFTDDLMRTFLQLKRAGLMRECFIIIAVINHRRI